MSLHKDEKNLITKAGILLAILFFFAVVLRVAVYIALKGEF